MELDRYFMEIGASLFSQKINDYLGTNSPTDEHREFLKELFEKLPEFKIKTKIFRASRVGKDFPHQLKDKYVSGCRSRRDVESLITKRWDKGYQYILESKEDVECFDLYAFINHINGKYGKLITEFYQDENEVIFLFRSPYDWLVAKKFIIKGSYAK